MFGIDGSVVMETDGEEAVGVVDAEMQSQRQLLVRIRAYEG